MVAEHLRRLPFDLFARSSIAARAVELVHPEPGGLVLDVGGGPSSIQPFLDHHEVIASDLHFPTAWHTPAENLILADGAALPFADGAFDVVVCLDTLEHVMPEQRGTLVAEALRTSRGWVVLGCPCATPGVADADAALLSYVRHKFGEEFDTVAVLTEHLAYGHPDPEEITQHLVRSGAEVRRIPSGRLDRWLPMMFLFYELMALGRDDPVERVQAWYNGLLAADDLHEPAYRQIFIARLPDASGPPLATVVSALLPSGGPRLPDAAALGALRTALSESLVEAVADERRTVERLRAELDAAREEIEREAGRADAAELHVRSLLEFRDRVLNHPAMKMRRGIKRTLGR